MSLSIFWNSHIHNRTYIYIWVYLYCETHIYITAQKQNFGLAHNSYIWVIYNYTNELCATPQFCLWVIYKYTRESQNWCIWVIYNYTTHVYEWYITIRIWVIYNYTHESQNWFSFNIYELKSSLFLQETDYTSLAEYSLFYGVLFERNLWFKVSCNIKPPCTRSCMCKGTLRVSKKDLHICKKDVYSRKRDLYVCIQNRTAAQMQIGLVVVLAHVCVK